MGSKKEEGIDPSKLCRILAGVYTSGKADILDRRKEVWLKTFQAGKEQNRKLKELGKISSATGSACY